MHLQVQHHEALGTLGESFRPFMEWGHQDAAPVILVIA